MAVFKKHDEVYLKIEDVIVGVGTLRKVSPSDLLHGSSLGDSRFGIMIDEVFDEDAKLLFPLGDALTLHGAFQMEVCVLWNILDVSLVKDTISPLDKRSAADGGNEIDTTHSLGENPLVGFPDFDTAPEFASEVEEFIVEDSQSVSVEGSADLHVDDNGFRPTNDQVFDGDEVRLFSIGLEVGKAIVHQVDPAQFCHNVLIGVDNFSVRILSVEDGHEEDLLPFTHAGADTLGEAVGTFVQWAKSNL